MATKANFELKVGLFVFIALAILSIIIFTIGDFQFFRPGYTIRVLFSFVSGIEVGAPVRLAGVEVGEVKNIRIFYNGELDKAQIELLVWLVGCKVDIPRDSRAYINTLGLLGEKYLEITPGSQYDKPLQEGEALVGEDPVAMAEIAKMAYDIAHNLDEAISSINELVTDEEVKGSLKETVKDSRELTRDMRNLTNAATSVMEKLNKGEGTIGKLLTEDKLYRDLEGFVEDLRENPWKLLRKDVKKDEDKEGKNKKRRR